MRSRRVIGILLAVSISLFGWMIDGSDMARAWVAPHPQALLQNISSHAAAAANEASTLAVARQIGAPEAMEASEEAPGEGAAQGDTIQVDDQTVDLRAPSDEEMEAHENDNAYDYTREDPPEEGMSIWQWILSQIFDVLDSSETSRTITRIVIYALAAIAIGYGLLSVIRMEPRSKRRTSTSGYRADGLEDRVQETDFEPLIEQAMQDADYRSAIRLMYLHGLQKLDRSGLIEWAPDRTNRQYAEDLAATNLREPFREATRIFDIVWYGDVHVDQSDVQRLRPPFDTIRQQADASQYESASDDAATNDASTDPSSVETGGEGR